RAGSRTLDARAPRGLGPGGRTAGAGGPGDDGSLPAVLDGAVDHDRHRCVPPPLRGRDAWPDGHRPDLPRADGRAVEELGGCRDADFAGALPVNLALATKLPRVGITIFTTMSQLA